MEILETFNRHVFIQTCVINIHDILYFVNSFLTNEINNVTDL